MADYFEHIPKIELHFHLRGAVPLGAMWELAQKYECTPVRAEFDAIFTSISDFRSFWRAYDFATALIKTEEDLAFAAAATAKRLAGENVIYAEISLTPFAFGKISPNRVLEIARQAFAANGVESIFIAPFERHDSSELAAYKYDFYKEARVLGVRGIGLAGDECANPEPAFPKMFERAKEDGFGIAVHAGEYRHSANIAYAVKNLFADRVGHGNNIADEWLADLIKSRDIHIEMCPLSNIKLNKEITVENYDLPGYHRRGMSISINSDDPGLLGHTLAENYRFAAEKYDLGLADFRCMLLNAVRASFAAPTVKAALKKRIEEWNWNSSPSKPA
jgi:adenosine deaminase